MTAHNEEVLLQRILDLSKTIEAMKQEMEEGREIREKIIERIDDITGYLHI